MAHLLDKGDGLDGGNKDDYKDTAGDDTKKPEAWKKLIEKGPKVVIETIVNHEFEDKKADEKTAMEAEKDSNEQPLDKSKYSDFKDAGIKKYMYEKKLGKGHEFLAKDQDQNDNGDTPKTENKSWFKFGDSNWRPFVTYGVGALLIIAIASAVFWKNIADWWNGPAEEDGKGQVEGDEKEEESE